MADPTGVAAPRMSDGLHSIAAASSWATAEPSGFDLDTCFILQKGNLAVLQEAQALLADALHATARSQQGYLEQLQRDFSPLAAVGRGLQLACDVVALAVDAQARIGTLLSRGLRLNLDR